MKKRYSIIIIILLIILLGGGIWFGLERNKKEEIKKQEVIKQEEIKTDPKEISEIDTSDWQTYRNEELGFEFKYPKNWKMKEVSFPIKQYIGGDSNQVFRYISMEASNFKVVLGIKNDTEKNVESRSWRTGLPEGDFEKGGSIRIGNGLIEKRYLIYKDNIGSHVNLIWYCQPGEDIHKWCNNFSIGKNKSAFVEVDVSKINNDSWKKVEENVEDIIRTFKFF